jgi:hypothetical protein
LGAWERPFAEREGAKNQITVIDIHTHMLTLEWIELLRAHGAAVRGRIDRPDI